MYLFVWTDVFCDWTCGIAFAIAPTPAEAVRLAVGEETWVEELLKKAPDVHPVTEPFGTYVYGGG